MMRTKSVAVAVTSLLAAGGMSSCASYENLNSLPLPGDKGVGSNSYEVKVEVQNALNIVPNSPVRVGDLNVGTIRNVDLVDNMPVVTISLGDDVKLPANTRAAIGQTSLLGAKHLELVSPPAAQARGELHDGSVIPLERTEGYPETEDVLAATAALLNGGGLSQLQTITTELNKALGGRVDTTRQLLGRSTTLATNLDRQKGSIVRALESMNRLSSSFAQNTDTINGALKSFPPALRVLSKDRRRMIGALESLGEFGRAVGLFTDRGGRNLVRNIAALQPTLKGLADAGSSLTDSLWLAGTAVFPLRTMGEYIRGDYVNLWGTIDITPTALNAGLLQGTSFASLLAARENLLGQPTIGLSGQAGDPLTDPLTTPAPTGDAQAGADSTDEATPSTTGSSDGSGDTSGGLLGSLLGGRG